MNLNSTVDNKDFFTKPNGDIIIDFTNQRFNPNPNGNIYDIMVTTFDFVMRPDLIAKSIYRDITSADLVMKQNSISNPFSIDEGDVFYIQEKSNIERQFSLAIKSEQRDIVRNQYIDPSKATEIDGNLKRFEDRNKPKKGKRKDAPALPPNFANFGDKEIKLRGGKIIFGEDITANKEVCNDEPLSKSELLKRLAINRLNKR